MEKCKRCGADIQPGQKMCDNCGLRLAAAKSTQEGGLKLAGGESPKVKADASPPPAAPPKPKAPAPSPTTPSLRMAEPSPAAPPPPATFGGAAPKSLCAGCMNSFDASELADFKGKLYCSGCVRAISQETSEPRTVAVEVAGGAIVEHRTPLLLKLIVIFGFLALIIGSAAAVYYIITKKEPTPPPVDAIDDTGTPSTTAPRPGANERPPASFPLIEVPVSANTKSFPCPVCQQPCGVMGEETFTCPSCGRKLFPVVWDEFPSLKYVAKTGEIASFLCDGKEISVPKGKEVVPDSGITVAGIDRDGVLLMKSLVITYQDHRPGQQGEKKRTVEVQKKIHKFREGGPIPIEVTRGTKSITCNGKGPNRVYHTEPIIVPIRADEVGVYEVPCANPDCWNTFTVTVKEHPEIRCPISTTSEQVLCPQCGCPRILEKKGRPVPFICVECERRIVPFLWKATNVKYLKREGETALVEHEGKAERVEVGKELWPRSGIYLEGFVMADGKDGIQVRTNVEVKFTEFKTGQASDVSKLVPVSDIIPIEGG